MANRGSYKSGLDTTLRIGKERGVALLQFALIFPILMLLFVGIFDIGRMLAIQAILTKGAEEGLGIASKIANLDVDYRGMTPSDADYQNFVEARRRVLAASVRLPTSTLVSDFDRTTAATLVPLVMEDRELTLPADTPNPALTRGAALLRPGERFQLPNGTFVQHRKLPPDGSGDAPPQSPEFLMKTYPIEVHLYADVRVFFPIYTFYPALRTYTVHGQAAGFREAYVPKGPLPPDPLGPALPAPTAAPAPTATPLLAPEPTATPTTCPAPIWGNATTECRAGRCCYDNVACGFVICPGIDGL